MDIEKVRELVKLVEQSGIEELEIINKDTTIRIQKSPAAAVGMPAMAQLAQPAPAAVIAAAPVAAPATSLAQAQVADTDVAATTAMVAAEHAGQKQQPSTPDGDQQATDSCAICAVMSVAGNVLFAAPPLLLLPQAVEFLYLATDAEFIHLNAVHPAFRSRAPPVS